MKRFRVIVLTVLVGFIFSSWAMGDDKSKHEGDRHQHKPGYGGWGGPMPLVMFPNMDSFDPLTDALGIGSFPGAMFMIGGMGSGQLGPHFRIGGAGAGGNLHSSGEVGGFGRSALIKVGYGGVLLYGLYPLNSKLELYGRLLLGGGGFDVRVKGEGIEEWSESEAFFVWHPAIGVAYHPLRWMSLEIEGGYFGMTLPDMHWKGQTVIEGGLAGGPTLQLNILFGWKT